MGSIIMPILKSRQPEMILLMISFADSGKTTILYQLKYGEKLNTAPNIGFNMETIIKVRQLDELLLLIYVNRANAKKRMPQVKAIDRRGLQTLDRKWYIQDTDALTEKEVEEGILWLKAAIETEHSEAPYFIKTWRWIGDIKANIRDINNSIFAHIGRIFSLMKSDLPINQSRQYIKSRCVKQELDSSYLENYINLFKDKRGQLFDEFKREYGIMKNFPGRFSKRNSEQLCKKIDKEMHQLFEQIQGAQKKLDCIV